MRWWQMRSEKYIGVRSYRALETKVMSKLYAKLDKAIGEFYTGSNFFFLKVRANVENKLEGNWKQEE